MKGGKRNGAGRPKNIEPTKVIYRRVPEKLYDEAINAIDRIIKEHKPLQ